MEKEATQPAANPQVGTPAAPVEQTAGVKELPSLESSKKHTAEKYANGVGKVILVLNVFIASILILGGFQTLGGYSDIFGWIAIGVGILLILTALFVWSILSLFVNMSYRLTQIDLRLKEMAK